MNLAATEPFCERLIETEHRRSHRFTARRRIVVRVVADNHRVLHLNNKIHKSINKPLTRKLTGILTFQRAPPSLQFIWNMTLAQTKKRKEFANLKHSESEGTDPTEEYSPSALISTKQPDSGLKEEKLHIMAD